MALNTEPNLRDHDGFYEDLLKAHRGLEDDEAQRFHARLILILANHIGDSAVLREALVAARPVREG